MRKNKWKIGSLLRRYRRTFCALMGIIMIGSTIGGCSLPKVSSDDKNYILTTGFSKNEIFRIDTESCFIPEMMLYLTNIQNRYETVYGAKIWEISLNDVSLESNVKEVALARMAQLKCMQLLAKKYEITLGEEEKRILSEAAEEYYATLEPEEISAMGISIETVQKFYHEYYLSTKVYEYMIKDVNPEISDDEARSIKVESILIKNYYLDENGNKVPYSKQENSAAYQKAKKVVRESKEGVSFEELIEKYNEDSRSVYSFGKGDMDQTFEEAAYNLDKEEVSEVVTTQYGFHIIKCLSTFDEDETNANKEKILEERKKEAFNESYHEFTSGLAKYLNEDVWENVRLLKRTHTDSSKLFEIYDKYVSKL